jgi:hypothetical protein
MLQTRESRTPTPFHATPQARVLLVLGCLLLGLATVPRFVCARRADAVFDGERATQIALANGVVSASARRSSNVYYRTGSLRFDGQSAVAVDQMLIMGLSQVVQLHPELREKYLPAMREAARNLADPRTLAYATRVYGHHGVRFMATGEGHAYLGYINLGLGSKVRT